jgi:hypothetical protein
MAEDSLMISSFKQDNTGCLGLLSIVEVGPDR